MSGSAIRTVGWIGLGEMGLPMTANLVSAGYRVLAYDIDTARVAAAETAGATSVGSIAEAASEADVVVAMLRTADQIEAVLTGDGGIAAAAPSGQELAVVVMSTLNPSSIRGLAQATAGRLSIVDAPVSGGVKGAEAGTLAIMASGPPATLARVRPLLDVLGGSIFELGTEAGFGQVAKLANQVMMSAALAGTLEALELARDYGLGEGEVAEVVLAGTGASWVLQQWPWMRSLWESYEPGNALDILLKDLRAVLADGEARSAAMPVSSVALTVLLAARDRGFPGSK